MTDTNRGCDADQERRVAVQEACLALDAFTPPEEELDTLLLAGAWRLLYTSALDVLVLLQAEKNSFGLLTVVRRIFMTTSRAKQTRQGDIFQDFDAYGNVSNVIRLRGVLGDATAKVRASYSRVGRRSLSLSFQDASLGDVRVGPTLESLVVPALLPRTPVQMGLLSALQALSITLPVPGGGGMGAAGSYLLSFLDEDTLIGRALAGGGLFIFCRDDVNAAK